MKQIMEHAPQPVPRPAGRRSRRVKALIDGVWHGNLVETEAVRARLEGSGSGFHRHVTADGASGFRAEPGRYRLYVSYACPWAHRTIIYRALKGLEDIVPMSVLNPRWAGPDGWHFGPGDDSEWRCLHEVYQAARSDYTGRVTVPVLWDQEARTIVNNQSLEIIRMLNSAFDQWGDRSVDFYPSRLRAQIDAQNAWLIPEVCQGVYRAGFARDQDAYESAVRTLFRRLGELEQRLSRQPFLLGSRVTESDWHLFATLCRFDVVYHGALKCSLRRLVEYPALAAYTRRLHQIPGVAQTVRFDHMKRHYYDDIGEIDPAIVPLGPDLDYRSANRVARVAPFSEAGSGRCRPDAREVFRTEVVDLHRFLEDWLKGDAAREDFVRLADALAADFVVIHPSGRSADKAAVMASFAAAFGRKPKDYRLEISDLSLRILDGVTCLVTYRETHAGEPGRSRISSALLRRTSADTVEWLFLHETLANTPDPS